MEYEVIEVVCIACLKPTTPADVNMDSFRLGIPAHNVCLEIVDRFIKAYEKLSGNYYYGGAPVRAQSISQD